MTLSPFSQFENKMSRSTTSSSLGSAPPTTMANISTPCSTMASKRLLPFMERIHVLGSGSIGLLFASSIRMAFPSYPITMLLRPHHEGRLTKDGSKHYMELCITQQQQQKRNRPRLVRLPAQIIGSTSGNMKIRNLLLATKAPDAAAAIRSIQSNYLQPDTRIFVLCNGQLAVREELQELLPHNPLTLISTTHGAYREQAGDDFYHVTHAGIGKTHVENNASFAKLLDQSGLQAESISNMDSMLWLKLAANCTINPLTAILGCTNGALTSNDKFQNMAPSILDELAQICPLAPTPKLMHDFVTNVISDTADNKSSMLQDVENKRTTEIDYLNGWVVQKGKELGIPTPVNQAVCDEIKELTATTTLRTAR